jgi:hypothetical protein
MLIIAAKLGIPDDFMTRISLCKTRRMGNQVNRFSRRPQETKRPPSGQGLVVPDPKLKLMDQVREVLRVKH